ncbi:Protein of unknown function DUF2253, membrane [Haliangium ochraceum DSM 14365]|uniref:Transmembrane protein n=1 Tax=Haliangium ochraceum (strain DSM 14365 / JCM 11303 / SMP-2) TaxID=502025 RepID=D0LXG3_HALO1|nr:DUF962 domain-containing protein [Haliangium ochraceum]ACY17718.1 Protein of unknown function DUF2253, membrane [Haliangium ochraceum DSM 14365]
MSEHTPKMTTFEEFWPYYVSQHLDPTCRKLHFVGTSLALGCLALAPFKPSALLAAPVFGYGFAWAGHALFEKNRPATFTHPLWSLRGDFRMWWLTCQGRMEPELERARAMFAEYMAGATGEGEGEGEDELDGPGARVSRAL